MKIAIVISHDKYFWHKSIADILTLRPVWNLINQVETWPGKTHMITAPYITDNCWKLLILQTSQQLLTSIAAVWGPNHQVIKTWENPQDNSSFQLHLHLFLTTRYQLNRHSMAIWWRMSWMNTGDGSLQLNNFNWETIWGCNGAASDLKWEPCTPLIHLWLLQWPLTTSTTRTTGLYMTWMSLNVLQE